MEGIALLVIVAVVIIWFNRVIKKSLSVVESIIDVTADTSKDSLETYSAEISIMNAKKRSEQANELANIGTIISVKNIKDMLKDKEDQAKEETAA